MIASNSRCEHFFSLSPFNHFARKFIIFKKMEKKSLFIAIYTNWNQYFGQVPIGPHVHRRPHRRRHVWKTFKYSEIELCLSIAVNRSNLLLYIQTALTFFSLPESFSKFCFFKKKHAGGYLCVLCVSLYRKYRNDLNEYTWRTIDEDGENQ